MLPRRRNPVSSASTNGGTTTTSISTTSTSTTTDSMMIELHRNKSDDNHNNNNNHNHHADNTSNGIDHGNDSNNNGNGNSNNTNHGDHENGFSSSSEEESVPTMASGTGTGIGISRRNVFFLVLVFTGMIASSYFDWRNLQALTQHYGLGVGVVLDEAHYEDARKAYFKDTLNHHQRYTTTTQYHRPTGPSGQFILQPHSEFLPHIVWLASFPNSGTSYTMTMVARSSNKSYATNYGNEVTPPELPNSLSIYPRRPEGPFWPGLSGLMNTPRPLPDKYVITKTHCGSRCVNCGPDEYVETPETFLQKCAVGHAWLTPAKQRREYDVEYPPQDRVQKVIHLYRHPLHNIIARYHLIHRHHGPTYSNNTAWTAEHANDAVGLHKYCHTLDTKYHAQDVKFWGSKKKIPTAPCHGEFYKWTQWHNLVHEATDLLHSTVTDDEGEEEEEKTPKGETTQTRKPIPLHTIYYEDYNGAKLNTTAQGILDFLELTQVSPFRDFQSRSDYDHYFTQQERKDIHELIQSVANNRTWADIQDRNYF